jgi:NAD(P)-dependent dehydrogenase (short-subunit alcohol dehydrogenase family)
MPQPSRCRIGRNEGGTLLKDTAVITGTTHGIGLVTSLELARAGRSVVMLCRDRDAGYRVREQIRAQVPNASLRVLQCDLASLASVRECAENLRRLDGIDLLVNNAGMVSTKRRNSVDGFELTFATNYLGPFLLTRMLLDRMTPSGRIINVASRAHYRGRLDLDQVTNRHARYSSIAAYARSKLANVCHTFALGRRLSGTRITANCLHPGVVATNLLPRWLRVVKPLLSRVIFDAKRGAQTTLYLALSGEVADVSGQYFDENQNIQPAVGPALDIELQDSLWNTSDRWVGMSN